MRYYFISVFSILLCLNSYSQQIISSFSGNVIEASNSKPLAGVSVHASRSSRSFITDAHGNFTCSRIMLPDTLVFSCIGYTTRSIPLYYYTDQSLKIVLYKSEDVSMDSVIIYNTGYQSMSRERTNGSFTQVDNKTLNLQIGTNILDRLESVTSSVAFNKKNNTAPAISIRGLSTINGPTSPLIVLDNFPFEGNINSIDPDMIESVTILKDATAASIWGTRAGNGVIVINTKKAKYSQPLTIDFNSDVQIMGKPDIFYTKPISSADYIGVEKYLFAKGYYDDQLTDPYRPAISPVVEILDRASRGVITPEQADDSIGSLSSIDVRNDYNKYMYSNAVNQHYSINLNGGSHQVAWSASGGFDKNISSLSEKYQRVTARLENSFMPVKNLKIRGSLYVAGSTNASGKQDYTGENYVYPYSTLVDKNGNAAAVPRDYRLGYTDTAGNGKLLDWNYYPLSNYKHTYSNTVGNNLVGDIGVEYLFGKLFTAELKYQYESQQIQTKSLNDEQSYEARNLINLFSQLDPVTGVVTYIFPKGGILNTNNNSLKVNNIRGQLNYNRSWKRHDLVALLGSEIRKIRTSGESFTTLGYDPETLNSSVADYVNTYPIYTTGDYFYLGEGQNSFTEQLKRFVSFFGNAAYTYNNKYNVTISGRRDASNLFGVNTNQKWTPLWSAGLGWHVSDEPFYNSKLIPVLKLRGTYGFTGMQTPKGQE